MEVTLQEAKARYNKHSRKCLSGWALDAMRDKVWIIRHGEIHAASPKLNIVFRRSVQGYVFGMVCDKCDLRA